MLSFNGAVNGDNFKIYEEIFNEKHAINPNNCTAKGTFFVSHKYTNYSAVQVRCRYYKTRLTLFLITILRCMSVANLFLLSTFRSFVAGVTRLLPFLSLLKKILAIGPKPRGMIGLTKFPAEEASLRNTQTFPTPVLSE